MQKHHKSNVCCTSQITQHIMTSCQICYRSSVSR